MNKWVALAGLYTVQGLPHGFFGQAMPVLLREQGLDLRIIGLLSLVALPWALKFLWAPFLDRYSLWREEYRRSWIVLMNLAAASVLLLLSSAPLADWLQQGILLPVVLLLVLNLFIATQDIATDALAVENLAEAERGRGNGLQVAAYRVGMILSGGVLVSLFGVIGWSQALWLIAALMLLGTLPLLFFKPRPHVVDQQALWPLWVGFFRRPHAWSWLLLLVVYKAGDAFGTPMIRPMLTDAGLSLEALGVLLGTAGFVAGLLGALMGGLLVERLGRCNALLLFLLFEALALLLYTGLSSSARQLGADDPHLLLAVVIEHVAGGMGTAALFTVMMDFCREHCAAADYALQACLVIVAGMLAGALSGVSAHALGYDGHFVLAAVMCLLALPLVQRLGRLHELR